MHSQLASQLGLLVCLSSSAVGQAFDYIEISGTGAGQSHNGEFFDSAARNPLLSTSLSFSAFNLSAEQGTISGGGSSWYWNLNLTNVRVDDSTIGPDAEVTSVVYDLSLDPGQSQLPTSQESGWQLCADVWNGEFPPDFQPFNDNVQGDCRLVFGEECFTPWSLSFSPMDDSGSCQPPPSFSTIPACANVSNIQSQWTSLSLADLNGEGAGGGLQDRQGFYFESTAAHPSSESNAIGAAEAGKIRMLLLSQAPTNPDLGSASTTSYLCQTFKPEDVKTLNDEDQNGDSDSGSSEESGSGSGDEDGGNGAVGVRVGSGTILVTLALVVTAMFASV